MNLAANMKCTSMYLTLRYLIIAIDNYGVFVYKCENLKEPIGILALGSCKYEIFSN